MKTNETGQHIFQITQHRCQTAAFLCQRAQAQLDQLAKRRRRLQELLDELRKMRRACRYVPARTRDREVVALINILQRMPVYSHSKW